MQVHVARDLKDAAYDFKQLVWPVIETAVGGGRFMSLEDEKASPLAEVLDIYGGLDGLQIRDDCGIIRGLAIRVQWGPTNWHTFTIRSHRTSGAKTEYEKRRTALAWKRGGLGPIWPYFTVQAYVTERRTGRLIGAAVTTTETLYRYLETHTAPRRQASEDGNEFIYVDWDDYRQFTGAIVVLNSQGKQL